MKIRSGFVSNSSSSSFIIGVPNYTNLPIDECLPEMIRDRYNDAVEYNDKDDIEFYKKELEKYRKIAQVEYLKIFSHYAEFGTEDSVYAMLSNIPGAQILYEGE